MPDSDASFPSEIAVLYDRCLRPFLFEPYAEDLARRAAVLRPKRILAGTGVVTEALIKALPEAAIVATDLNRAMLDVAEARLGTGRVQFREADAQALLFENSSFDLVLCQFGAMFFPDRVAAYREARRVLSPGGYFLFNAWGPIEENEASFTVAQAVARSFEADARNFLQRVPFAYHNKALVEADLRAAGFLDIVAETVTKRSRVATAREAAVGLCLGTPLRAEIEARGPARLEQVIDAAATALAPYETDQGIDARMSANIFSGRA
jgi:ubiquinone/menaquinone biosynthesis C-methylase UbiE